MVEFEFKTLDQEQFPLWDKACADSDEAWLWHGSDTILYQLNYRPSVKSRNLSFFVLDANKDTVAICPLILEENQFSFGGGPLPAPATINGLTRKRREDIHRAIHAHIDVLAAEHHAVRCSMQIQPMSPSAQPDRMEHTFNALTKFGYLDVSTATQIVECRRPIADLQKDVRKGHTSDIKRGLKLMDVQVFDHRTITDEIFRAYQDLHHKAAGRVTRPQITFDIMHKLIKVGSSMLAVARKDGKPIGFALVELYKNAAYYGSAANDPEFGELPIAHVLQWKTVEWLHENGFHWYVIGDQKFGPQLHDHPSEKELHISHFKRGFGGRPTAVFAGEKYFDKAYLKDTLEKRITLLLRSP